MKKLTTEEFIKRAKNVHGDKYDYSKTNFVNTRTRLVITCPTHGDFFQLPNDHLKGCGCKKCFDENKRGKARLLTKEEFIKRAQEVHGNKYDYSKVVYENMHKKVIIICPEHGEFKQTPNGHLSGKGCKKCGYEQNRKTLANTREEFIRKANNVHGGKYDYSKVDYINNKTKVCIICPEHGEFFQKPNTHLNGEGCYKCYYKIYDNESFINEAKKVHGDKYDYSKALFNGVGVKLCIICPEHGEFWQTPSGHVHKKNGCPTCNEKKLERETRLSLIKRNINFVPQKRFNWLGQQSLDFYLPDYGIGIECQGIQHFEPTDFSGKGNKEENFKYVKLLDEKKKILCEKNNVKLHYINYFDDVEAKLDEILV